METQENIYDLLIDDELINDFEFAERVYINNLTADNVLNQTLYYEDFI